MTNNFVNWGNKRIEEIPIDPKLNTMTAENKQQEKILLSLLCSQK